MGGTERGLTSMKKRALCLALILALAAFCALGISALGAEDAENRQVLFDGGGVTVSVTGYEPEGTWGPVFFLLLENGANRSMDFSLDRVSVNGVMCGQGLHETVPAVKSAAAQVEWFDEDLDAAGVNYIEAVEAYLTVQPGGDKEAEPLFAGKVSWAAPAGEHTGPAVTEHAMDEDFEPVPLMEGDLAVTAIDYDPDGPAVLLQVDNGTDSDLWLHMKHAKVDGELSEPYWSAAVSAGKRAYAWCRWDEDDLESPPKTAELTIEAVDLDTLDPVDEATAELMFSAVEASAATAAPEATEAPLDEDTAPLGVLKAGRYENAYFGLAFEPGENWHFMTEEQIRALQSASVQLIGGDDAESYMDMLAGSFVASASTLDGRMNVNIMVRNVPGLAEAADQEDFLDLVLGDVGTEEDGAISLPGMENATVRRNTVTLAGQELPGLLVQTGSRVLGMDMSMTQQQAYAVKGDWFMQLSLTCLSAAGGAEDMTALFTPMES